MKPLVTLLIIALLLGAVYYYIMIKVARISFEIYFKNLDTAEVNIGNLVSGQATVKVAVGTRITNRNDFSIRLSDFHIWIYYNGVMIAQTADTQNNLTKVNIPANGLIDVTHEVNVSINQTTLQVLKDLKNKKELKFDYTTEFKVWGIPVPKYSDYFTYKF